VSSSTTRDPRRLPAKTEKAKNIHQPTRVGRQAELADPAAPGAWMAPPLSQAELLADSIPDAIARYTRNAAAHRTDAARGPSATTRLYTLPEVTVVLGAIAISLLALESEGLLTWARRMEVGRIQTACVATFRGIQALLDPIGLTAPRRLAIDAGDRLARMLGAGDDPLLADGWHGPISSAEPEPPIARRLDTEPEPEPDHEPPTIQRADPALEVATSREGDDTANAPMTVLLLGDSMIAGSLGSAIASSLSRDPKPRVVRAVQTATGLSRPDVFDWMKVVPPLLEREKPQLIVCSFGANDATNIREGDRLLEFGHVGWRSAYGERVAAMMQLLAGQTGRVLWLGLPPMRESWFSERARYLNRIFAQTAKQFPQVEYFDLEMLVSAPNGEYATFIRNADGRFVRVRMDDGVHYSPSGAKAVARWVVDWIYERRARLSAARRSN
jgi:uncharacterized protein